MSKRLFKTMAAVLAIAAAAAGPVRGQTSQTSTLNFTAAYGSGPATADDEVEWTVTSDGNESNFDNTKGIHYGTGSAQVQYIQLSTSDIIGTITQVKVNASTASNVTATVGVTVGGSAFGGNAQSLSADATDYTFTGSATGTIVVRVAKPSAAVKALYVKSIEVTYTPASSGGGSTPAVPYTVTFAEGTEDVGNWSFTPAAAAAITGVTAGTVVTVKYNGTRRINSIEAMVDGPSLTTPLTIEALTAGTIVVNISGSLTLSTGMKYAVNGGEKTLITTTTTIPVNAGDKVQFYGNGTSTTEYGNNPEVNLRGTAETKVYGNIMSLLDETGYETATAISGNYVFYGLFRNNAYLKDASGLLLPAMTLANDCYSNMFNSCTGLTEAPVLPAPTLVSGCYNAMFYGCNNLASVTCLATSGIDASGSTSYWLEGAGSNVTGTKTFNAVSTATWPGNYNGIPEGWTRQAIGAQSTPEPVTLVPTGNTNEWTLTMPADNMLLMVNYAPAPTLHTVRFAEGMSGWQVQDVTASASAVAPAVLQNVMAGDSLVVTAPATLPGKVKSVKAEVKKRPEFVPGATIQNLESFVEVENNRDGTITLHMPTLNPSTYNVTNSSIPSNGEHTLHYGYELGSGTNMSAIGTDFNTRSGWSDHTPFSELDKTIDITSGKPRVAILITGHLQSATCPAPNQEHYWGLYRYTNPVKVTYNLGGGSVSGSTADKVEYLFSGDALATTFAAPTREGFTFDGWYTSAEGGTKLTASNATSATTIYAHWNAIDE